MLPNVTAKVANLSHNCNASANSSYNQLYNNFSKATCLVVVHNKLTNRHSVANVFHLQYVKNNPPHIKYQIKDFITYKYNYFNTLHTQCEVVELQSIFNRKCIGSIRTDRKANSLSQSVCRTMELNMFVDWGNYWPS